MRSLSWILPCALASAGCSAGTSSPESTQPAETDVRLHEVPDAFDFRHRSGASKGRRLREVMGSGCALFDADGDGDLDAFLAQGVGSGRFYLNAGEGRFVDATEASGLDVPSPDPASYGTGVAVGDVEGDGDLDLYTASIGADRLWRNRGDGTFEDVTLEAGVRVGGWSTSVAFFDPDGDGLLDIWVARYVRDDETKHCTGAAGRPDYCNPRALPALQDVFLKNTGEWSFENRSEVAGIPGVPAAAGLGVVSFDVNRDGRQDVIVANDGYPNHVWLNQGSGRFREAGAELGAAYDAYGAAEAGMGIVAADLSGDARLDVFLTHLAGETNTLYRGGTGGFDDASVQSGLGRPSVPYTGFGTAVFDAELDGDLDVVVVNGAVTRAIPAQGCVLTAPWDEYAQPDMLYENRAGQFVEVGGAWSQAHVEVSRALACGDVDGDGDLDLLTTQVDGPARLWFDQSPRRGSALFVRALEGERDALGAEIRLEADGQAWVRLVAHTSSYLSAGPAVVHFGVPTGTRLEGLQVRWADGAEEAFDLGAGDVRSMHTVRRVHTVRRGEGEAR